MAYLIADSGSTKCTWCLVNHSKKNTYTTIGLNPYFLSINDIVETVSKSVALKIKQPIEAVYFYGTGLGNTDNIKAIKTALQIVFKNATIEAETDLVAAARSLLQHNKGVACILGTGSNSGYYNGKKITKNSPALGYVLGDEGSGAYLGKKVIQYYLYNTFDDEMMAAFEAKFKVTKQEILNNVYKQPLANKYLAAFTVFLSENRGHYMIENIIEDGLHDFVFQHLYKYRESWLYPISFTGSVAFAFKDVLAQLCSMYELQLGTITKEPMQGLIKYHSNTK